MQHAWERRRPAGEFEGVECWSVGVNELWAPLLHPCPVRSIKLAGETPTLPGIPLQLRALGAGIFNFSPRAKLG
jgi:hypothetical protein